MTWRSSYAVRSVDHDPPNDKYVRKTMNCFKPPCPSQLTLRMYSYIHISEPIMCTFPQFWWCSLAFSTISTGYSACSYRASVDILDSPEPTYSHFLFIQCLKYVPGKVNTNTHSCECQSESHSCGENCKFRSTVSFHAVQFGHTMEWLIHFLLLVQFIVFPRTQYTWGECGVHISFHVSHHIHRDSLDSRYHVCIFRLMFISTLVLCIHMYI